MEIIPRAPLKFNKMTFKMNRLLKKTIRENHHIGRYPWLTRNGEWKFFARQHEINKDLKRELICESSYPARSAFSI
jgi:hypothetical protein